ncbi:hypothetical protein HYW82_03025 [Candidatus Peregrinibacteria bacterium]|nr:hypothetical protein [Candidatus Peregrinibacteria bacterium]
MLKRLFTSNTRIKLLTLFLMSSEKEFFIRELTRRLDEQINSVRRELDNLKRLGLLKSKTKNRKKYYCVNNDFVLLEELKGIIVKALSSNDSIARDIQQMGDIKVLALSGVFLDAPTETVDMLIVGNIDKEQLANYISSDLRTPRPIKFSIITEDDYKYRLNCKDKFIASIINNPQTQIPVNKLGNL